MNEGPKLLLAAGDDKFRCLRRELSIVSPHLLGRYLGEPDGVSDLAKTDSSLGRQRDHLQEPGHHDSLFLAVVGHSHQAEWIVRCNKWLAGVRIQEVRVECHQVATDLLTDFDHLNK